MRRTAAAVKAIRLGANVPISPQKPGDIPNESLATTLDSPRPHLKPAQYSFFWVAILFISDLAMFAGATTCSMLLVRAHYARVLHWEPPIISAALVIAFQLLIFERLGLYKRSVTASLRDELYYTTAAVTLGAAPLLVFFTLLPQLSSSRMIIFTSLTFSTIAVALSRASIRELRAVSLRRHPRRVAIVGRRENIAIAADSLNLGDDSNFFRITVDDMDAAFSGVASPSEAACSNLPWFAAARNWECDLMLLTETVPPRFLPTLLSVAARHRIKVAFAPPRFRVHAFSVRLETIGQQALIVPMALRACAPDAQLVKRIMDTFVGAILLTLALPAMLACALAIKLESPGPIFYRQQRVGLHGKVFDIIKLRSMRDDAEASSGPVWAAHGDPRVTRIGKFVRRCSIDELPQLFNVLKGDMSLVGPRPERPIFVQQFEATIPRYNERHLVRPGITGWSQVNMKRALKPSQAADKLSYDLFYIEQWSPFLDLYIVTKTAFEFLFHRAA
jgi:exopolysaccharide biosynthesis polyprenyl glycosylphosphotransferase